jgi:hypothetical protein
LNALTAKNRVVGPAALALLVTFWLPWYSIGPSPLMDSAPTDDCFIAVLDSIVLVLYVLITAFGLGDLAAQGGLSKDQLLVLTTGVNVALVGAGLPAQTGRIQLVVGRLSRADRRHRGFSAVRPVVMRVCSVFADGLVYRHIHAGRPDAESMATIQAVVGEAHFQQKILTLPP